MQRRITYIINRGANKRLIKVNNGFCGCRLIIILAWVRMEDTIHLAFRVAYLLAREDIGASAMHENQLL